MIAAAAADGEIDPAERQAILGQAEQAGLGAEERSFLERELASPPSLDEVLAQVKRPELAPQVYAASLLAIEVDTPAEERHLTDLARRLGLDPAVVADLNQRLGYAGA